MENKEELISLLSKYNWLICIDNIFYKTVFINSMLNQIKTKNKIWCVVVMIMVLKMENDVEYKKY